MNFWVCLGAVAFLTVSHMGAALYGVYVGVKQMEKSTREMLRAKGLIE